MLAPDCYPAPEFVAVLLVMLGELMPIFSYVLLSGLGGGTATQAALLAEMGAQELAGGEETEERREDGNSLSCPWILVL